jgi:hypothetical protein
LPSSTDVTRSGKLAFDDMVHNDPRTPTELRRQVEELEIRGMVEIYQRVLQSHTAPETRSPKQKETAVMKYTVVNPVDESCVYGRGLTTLQAAEAVLTHDGFSYEIRRADPNRTQWDLWVSTAPAGLFRETPYMKRAAIPSVWAPTPEEAWPEIAALVLQHCRS